MDDTLSRGLIVFIFGLLGIIIAGMLQIAYDNGYVINAYIGDVVTLPGVQILAIVVALLMGVIVAMVAKP